MIERYTRPEMGALWADKNRFQKWLDVELAVLETLARAGQVPKDAPRKIRKAARIKVARIHEIEKVVKHDVIAFTTSISEQVGPVGRYFHFGLTSSDVVDTALSLLLKEALTRILEGLERLDRVLAAKAFQYRDLPTIGRTHGVHAEPTSFGLKFLGWLTEFRRQRARVEAVRDGISVGKLSGAVGSYGALTPALEGEALAKLGLAAESVATQVLPRDRHADLFCALAGLGASVERVATELRHLQRTEVHEVEEDFGTGQKGSSAMPHKRNPISAENLTGCARLLRGYAVAALENVALWHERDISHSSVERVIAPDATILADYMINRLAGVVERLVVRTENVERNLDRTKGIYFSGHVLLALVEKGMSREDAYRIVQRCAHSAWDEGRWFGDLLAQEPEIKRRLSQKELQKILDVKNYLKNVDIIYKRVLGKVVKRGGPKKRAHRVSR